MAWVDADTIYRRSHLPAAVSARSAKRSQLDPKEATDALNGLRFQRLGPSSSSQSSAKWETEVPWSELKVTDEYANECQRMSKTMLEQNRKAFLEIAEAWIKLAEEAEAEETWPNER